MEGQLEPKETVNNSVKRESIDLGRSDEVLSSDKWENPANFTDLQCGSTGSDMSIEEKMALNKKRRRLIFEETRELRKRIYPLEFEAYKDYFILAKFQKGVSASGRVGCGENRTKSTGVYYEKITRTGENGTNVHENLLDSDDEKQKQRANRRSTRSQITKLKQEPSDTDPFLQLSPPSLNTAATFFDTSISASSIIPSNNVDTNFRRSSRLSQREREILEKKAMKLEEAGFADAVPKIVDLFESIIPKTMNPVRRSDWLLPNKNRFIPEKFAPVKHTPEQIKINDLIHNTKIRKIMKRFKGGLAGVRKKDWKYVKDVNHADKSSI
ncbi:LAME_0C04588g1_1 [Lachancea meyersii CBS 8951]|uniref:LAME_0C04588g1_1 n=1 Tax=Lachancea meyersii CBS 8951 TaxID=1266667 RepID=A0A1G4J1L1_9SACH|nr:LAME_0C04588g1_1 [Lachancea meyersii CBS 8951]